MSRPGWNATRRNKNIGTAKAGHGQDNRMKIPESWNDGRSFHEKLQNPVVLSRLVKNHEITMLVEPVNPGFYHACTPDDIVRVLNLLPPEHTEWINLIVLRQPKRKERIMNPVWGRLQYWTKIQQYTGVAIHLEAQPIEMVMRWPKSLCVDDAKELVRLSEDGHQIVSDRRYHKIHTNSRAVRNTQLYRTLPHELGHYVDYLIRATNNESNLHWSKSSQDKEAFANRYADEFLNNQKIAGNIPFEPIIDESGLRTECLEPFWFLANSEILAE
jgi:hypothetical protein